MPRIAESNSSGLSSTPLNASSRREHNGTSIQGNEWKDWTSTWRKVGTSSQTKHVTMTGTITRGKKRGQSVDIELDLTEHELTQLSNNLNEVRSSDSNVTDCDGEENTSHSCCSVKTGLHIIFLGILCFPFVFLAAILVCFYFGLLTWHNVFSYFYDEKTLAHRIFICPLLILIFPIFIILTAFCISIYAAAIQISWSYENWKNEIGSFEKGFYGWLCSWLSIESCSPYSVVVLADPDNSVLSNNPDDNRVSVVEEIIES